MEIENPFGDYEPNYALQEGSELLLERATNSNVDDNSNYTVTFVDMDNGKFGYQLATALKMRLSIHPAQSRMLLRLRSYIK